ncbi:MAG: FIST C-terminal domain-containing protein [Myxococcales bacterium]|nr:FIST C-terminal domain-containing protein [Myxococcales bacterium]
MTVRVGVGKSTHHQPRTAGEEAATAALAGLDGRAPDLVLVFATTGYDQAELLCGVRARTADAPLAGCSAEGVITQDGSDEGSHVVGVMVLASELVSFDVVGVGEVASDPGGKARELARAIAERSPAAKLVLLFVDGLTVPCSELLGALEAALPMPVALAGGTAGDALRFERTYQYLGAAVRSDAVVAVTVSGPIVADIAVSHGCDPVGAERQITRAGQGFVHEIAGRPAWSFLKDYLPDSAEGLDGLNVAYMCVAESLPAEAGSSYGEYIVRVPLRLDAASGALFFAGGLREGAKVRVAIRQHERVAVRAAASAESIRARHPDDKPLCVLQFDCAGRGRLLFAERTTEVVIDPVQRILGKDVPWLGLHTFGEIAQIGPRAFFHNYTVVLCALYREAGGP